MRAFASLNPQEALHLAIAIENRNATLYHQFAEMFVEFRDEESLEIAGVFWDMAVEERRHASLLAARYRDRYGKAECALTEDDLNDLIEVPKVDAADLFANPSEGPPSPRERALAVALRAEAGAKAFYAKLVVQAEDGPLRRLYQELAEMEEGHVEFLRRKLGSSTGLDRQGRSLKF